MMMTWALQPWMDQHDQPTATLESSKFVLPGYPQMVLLFVQLLGICILSSWTPWMSYQTLGPTVSHIPGSNQAGTFESMSFPNLPNLLGYGFSFRGGVPFEDFFPLPLQKKDATTSLSRGNPWCRLKASAPFQSFNSFAAGAFGHINGGRGWSWLIPGFQLLSIKDYQKHLISTNSRHEHEYFWGVFFWRKTQGVLLRSIQSKLAFFGSSKTGTTDPRWIRRRQHRWSQCQLGPMKVGFRLERSGSKTNNAVKA